MSKNIILIGMRGSGKSTLGKLLAVEKKWDFVDTDAEIEKKAGEKVADIVREKGWLHFRVLEAAVCQEVGERMNTVIAVGGGAILDPHNVQALKKNGTLIFLWVPLQELCMRLEQESANRPQLTDKSSLREEIAQIWAERRDVYFAVADGVWREEGDDSREKFYDLVENILK